MMKKICLILTFLLALVCTQAHAVDYQGSYRMVVNREAAPGESPEQVTHYYPYGGVIGDISTNETLQSKKFEGKELDRTFGLDWYDIHARNYFAMLPSWDRPDSKAEDYYGIGPYVYCGGNPTNLIDNNGNHPVLVGMIAGGLWAAGSAVIRGDDWKHVTTSAIGGAVDGAITASGGGVILRGAIGGAVGKTVENMLNNIWLEDENIDYVEDGFQSAILGAMSGGLSHIAGYGRTDSSTPTKVRPSSEIEQKYKEKEVIKEHKTSAKQKLGTSATDKAVKKEGQKTRKKAALQERCEIYHQVLYESVVGSSTYSFFDYTFVLINNPIRKE